MATGRSLGVLTIDLIAKISGFVQGMTAAERAADRSTKKIAADAKKRAKETEDAWKAAGASIRTTFVALAGIAAGGAVFGKFITETVNAQKEQALLAAVLKSTGNQAGFSQQRLNEMAGAMENVTGISAGEFNQAQKVILGFTNIVGDQLPKALQAAADHAASTGSTVAQSAEIMGRALDVPSVGMASLQKQGFKFSESQIELARKLEQTGQVAKAQQIIFDALNETYGGAAVAARDTLGGALNALKNTMNSLMTGEGGSVDGLKNSVNDLANTLGGENVRSAFQTLIGWAAEAANAFVKMAAAAVDAGSVIKSSSLWGWLQVGKQDSDNVGASIKETEGKIKDLQATVASMSRPLHRLWNADDIIIANGQISTLQSKLTALNATQSQQQRAAGMMGNMLGLGSIGSTALSPDLPARVVGAVNLRDGAKKSGGKSQAEKDAEAADKFLKSLREQLFKTEEYSAYEKLIFDIKEKQVKLSAKQMDQAVAIVTQIDMAKEAERQRTQEMEEQNDLFEAQNRILAQRQQYELALSAYGMGDKEGQRLQEQMALMQKQQAELRQLENDRENALAKEMSEREADSIRSRYASRIALLKDTHAVELKLEAEQNEKKKALDNDWWLGAQSSIKSYLEGTVSMYDAGKSAITGFFSEAEGALVSFVKTGKLDLKSIVDFAIAELSKLAIKDLFSTMGGGKQTDNLGNLFTNVLGLFGFASGGYTGAGGRYELAGAVHKGEVVWSQDDVSRAGGVDAVESMRLGGFPMPEASSRRAQGGNMQQTNNFILPDRIDRQTQNQIAMNSARALERSRRMSA